MSDYQVPSVCPLCGDLVDSTCEIAVEFTCLSCGGTRYHRPCAEKYACNARNHGHKKLNMGHKMGLYSCPKGSGKADVPVCQGVIASSRLVKQQPSEAKKAKKMAALLASSAARPPLPPARPPLQPAPLPQAHQQPRQQQWQQKQQQPLHQHATKPASQLLKMQPPTAAPTSSSQPAPGTRPLSAAAAAPAAAIPGADYVTRAAAKRRSSAERRTIDPPAPPRPPSAGRTNEPQQQQLGTAVSLPHLLQPPPHVAEQALSPPAIHLQSSAAGGAQLVLSAVPLGAARAPDPSRHSCEGPPATAAAPSAAAGSTAAEPPALSRAAPLLWPCSAAPSVWVTDLARYNQLLLGQPTGGHSVWGAPAGVAADPDAVTAAAAAAAAAGTAVEAAAPPLTDAAGSAGCAESVVEEDVAGAAEDVAGMGEEEADTAALLAMCLGGSFV